MSDLIVSFLYIQPGVNQKQHSSGCGWWKAKTMTGHRNDTLRAQHSSLKAPARARLSAHEWRISLLCLFRGSGECLMSDSGRPGLEHCSFFFVLTSSVVSSAHNLAKVNSKVTRCHTDRRLYAHRDPAGAETNGFFLTGFTEEWKQEDNLFLVLQGFRRGRCLLFCRNSFTWIYFPVRQHS